MLHHHTIKKKDFFNRAIQEEMMVSLIKESDQCLILNMERANMDKQAKIVLDLEIKRNQKLALVNSTHFKNT